MDPNAYQYSPVLGRGSRARLPNEVVGRVLELYTSKFGIHEAWKLRVVNRTFRKEIEFLLFTKIPHNALFQSLAQAIQKKYLAEYLKYRTKILRDAKDVLPGCINNILDQIEGISGRVGDDVRRSRIDVLCDLMAQQPGKNSMVTAPALMRLISEGIQHAWSVRTSQNLITTHKIAVLAAAFAIGDHIAVAQLMMYHHIGDLWAESYAFGSPFAAAASAGRFSMIDIMIADLQGMRHRGEEYLKYTPALSKGVDYAIDGGDVHVTDFILRAGVAYLMPTYHGSFKRWMRKAVATNNINMLNTVAQAKTTNVDRVHEVCFEDACELALPNMAAWFFQEGNMGIQQRYGLHRDICPLMTAVIKSPPESEHASSGVVSASVVKKLLEIGACPDGTPDYQDSPLAMAVEMDRWSIVRLLLNKPATIQSINKPATIQGMWSAYHTEALFKIAQHYHRKPDELDGNVQQRLREELALHHPMAAPVWGRDPRDLGHFKIISLF